MSNAGLWVDLWIVRGSNTFLVITDLFEQIYVISLRQLSPQSAPASPSKAPEPDFMMPNKLEKGRTDGQVGEGGLPKRWHVQLEDLSIK